MANEIGLIPVDFEFTSDELAAAKEVLARVKASPYESYRNFKNDIDELASQLPERFVDFAAETARRDFDTHPIVVMSNCPIDDVIPVLSNEDPRSDKLARKTTFVAEAFLAAYAKLTDTETIAHLTVNDGDFFHDIYPKSSMYDLQSAKTLKTLKFHRDFPTHFVAPDFINTITLRDTPENEVYSTFAVNVDVLRELSPSDIEILAEARFTTPVDDSSGASKLKKLDPVGAHPIIDPEGRGLKIFEGRTRGADHEADEVFGRVIEALHRVKKTRVTRPGDAVSFCNRSVIHGREVVHVGDADELAHRWLIKSHTVFSLREHEKYFLDDRYAVVNG
ncbi:hypothetical protein F4553_000867 [Allocatelliglobosispora scoriae]|uniref:TauD/TfdA-like domain-containing protein n=1 Tax=Allocatelliglobosispora scoriae TaxID=643052 RepID=A0A841BJH9_9ACTN|nr:hypothetical protein [Allocatelliglobosispora scoriae]MBB5867488.1 hypothetical protein [Allocatelliglobosispora scoriae]